MRPPSLILALTLALAVPVLALQASLAGVVDWHKALVGAPLAQPTPPAIYDVYDGDKAAQVYLAVTESNILAALDREGGIVWRQKLDDDDRVLSYHVHGDSVLLLSSDGGRARLFDLASGRLRWETSLAATPCAPGGVGVDVSFTPESAYVLTGGRRVTRLALGDGAQRWSWEFPGGEVVFKSVGVLDDRVVVFGVQSSFASGSIAHIVLDADNVFPFTDLSHTPSTVGDIADAHLVRTPRGGLRAVWTEYSRVRVAHLNADGSIGEPRDHLAGAGRRYARILDVGLRAYGYLVGQFESGTTVVLEVRDAARIVAEFDGSSDAPGSIYAGTPVRVPGDAPDRFEIMRIWSRDGWTMAQRVSIREGKLGSEASVAEHPLAYDAALGTPRIAAVVPNSFAAVVASSAGAIAHVAEADDSAATPTWVRDESLADLADVRFIDLGEPETEEALEVMAEESFVGRVTRHLGELKNLPGYIARFIERLRSSTTVVRTQTLSRDHLHRDQFGLQKLLLAVSRGGRVNALDSASGAAVWSRNLGVFAEHGPELFVESVHQTRNLSEAGNPVLAVVATRVRDGRAATVAFHIDAYTGEVAGGADEESGIPDGAEVFEGRAKKVFLTPFINCCTKNRVLAVVDGEDRLHIWPKCKKVATALEDTAASLFYSVLERGGDGTAVLRGYAPTGGRGADMSFGTAELWSRPLAGDVLSVAPLTPSETASFGRALGDKAVLYKYLNPHLVVVASVAPAQGIGHVSVIDSATGAAVHEVVIPGVSGPVRAAMVENWLVYAWRTVGDATDAGGWRLASAELYTSPEAGVRSSLAGVPALTVSQAAFVLDSDVRALAFTTSKFGVATKDLVYLNSAGQVAYLDRRLLDPRRPHGKPTKAETDEGLIPYDPVIYPQPQNVLSHKYPVVGLDRLATSPSLLESTGLLLAYGTDLFETRALQPSGTFDILGDGFGKFQLVVTLAALTAGVVVARPAVTRKALKAKWF